MAKEKTQSKEQSRPRRDKKKLIRHNTAANQEKHRNDWQPLTPNDLGLVADRRIMPRDELSRRHHVETASAETVGAHFDDTLWQAAAWANNLELGLVTEVSRGLCRVSVNDDRLDGARLNGERLHGERLLCDLRGTLAAEGTAYTNVVAVGDRVLFSRPEAEHGWVEQVLPRRSALTRPDPFYRHLKQIVVANADQLLIVAAWREPHLWLRLIDEYLIAAIRNNLVPLICINKVDLAEDMAACHALVQPYADLGYRLLLTSAVSGEGLDELRQLLRDKTTVLAGMSGVGKSSLLSAVEPGLNLRAKTVSEKSGEGRHTTTQVNLWPLAAGGYVIDTPGIRELGLQGLELEELITFYPEIEEAAESCRFSNCSHDHEPGCAVLAAVEDGTIAEWRYENYHKLYSQL
jgi:ribosome biogenesis GTPase